MTEFELCKAELTEKGFITIENIYSDQEIEQILATVNQANKTKETFRK